MHIQQYTDHKAADKILDEMSIGDRVLFHGMPNGIYHSQMRGLSSTKAKRAAYSGKCYARQQQKDNKPSEAMRMGSVIHNALETLGSRAWGEEVEAEFRSMYVVEEEIGLAAKTTNIGKAQRRLIDGELAPNIYRVIYGPGSKDAATEARNKGFIVFNKENAELVQNAFKDAAGREPITLSTLNTVRELMEQLAVQQFVEEYELLKQPIVYYEASVFYRITEELWLKCRPDVYAPNHVVIDWKSSKRVLGSEYFMWMVRSGSNVAEDRDVEVRNEILRACGSVIQNRGYAFNAAFYLHVLGESTFCLVLLDKDEAEIYPCVLDDMLVENTMPEVERAVSNVQRVVAGERPVGLSERTTLLLIGT